MHGTKRVSERRESIQVEKEKQESTSLKTAIAHSATTSHATSSRRGVVIRTAMEAADIEFIGPIQRDGSTSWNHFRAPDGTVFEILSKSDDIETERKAQCN